MKEMKYVVVYQTETDWFTKDFEKKEAAIKHADYMWNHLTDAEKRKCPDFYVLESVNPDEEAENHLDGDYVKKYIFTQEEAEKLVDEELKEDFAEYLDHNGIDLKDCDNSDIMTFFEHIGYIVR